MFLAKQFDKILSSADEYKMLIDVPIMSETNPSESSINTKCWLEKQQTHRHRQHSMATNAEKSSMITSMSAGSTVTTAPSAAAVMSSQPTGIAAATNGYCNYNAANNNNNNTTTSTSNLNDNDNDDESTDDGYDVTQYRRKAYRLYPDQKQLHNQHYEYMRQIQQASLLYKYLGNQQYQQQQHQYQTYLQYGNIGHSANVSTTAAAAAATTVKASPASDVGTWWYWATNSHLQNLGIVNMGCTNNPEQRLMILNMGAMNDYKYLALFQINNRWVAEKMISEIFTHQHIQRGFYRFDVSGTLTMSDIILKHMKRCMQKNYALFLIQHV